MKKDIRIRPQKKIGPDTKKLAQALLLLMRAAELAESPTELQPGPEKRP